MKKPVKAISAGAILVIGSLALGVGGTVIGMIRAFNQVASSGKGSSQELSQAISESLFTTMIGMARATKPGQGFPGCDGKLVAL